MAGRRTISIYSSTYERLNKWKKDIETQLGFKISWDAFFNYVYQTKTKK